MFETPCVRQDYAYKATKAVVVFVVKLFEFCEFLLHAGK